jgi:hypothetical protein
LEGWGTAVTDVRWYCWPGRRYTVDDPDGEGDRSEPVPEGRHVMSDADLVWAHMSQEALARLVQRVVGTVRSLRYLQHGSLTGCDSSWPNRRTQLRTCPTRT